MRIPLLVGPIRDLATWAHVRWPWSALGRLRTSFVGPLDIPVVCGNPLFGDWGSPVETRLDSKNLIPKTVFKEKLKLELSSLLVSVVDQSFAYNPEGGFRTSKGVTRRRLLAIEKLSLFLRDSAR